MRYLAVVTLLAGLSSCAVFEGAKSLLEGSYEAGKYAGKEEILQKLEENKKKLTPLKSMTIGDLVGLSKDEMVAAPLTITVIQLLLERNKLKKALESVKE